MDERVDRWSEEVDTTRYEPREPAPYEPPSDDLAAIRADIRQTRARMSHTVEDIGERLNPDRLKAQLKDNLHDATIGKAENMARNAAHRVDETRHSIVDTIRDNPIPAAMVGVGLGWLLMNGRRRDDDGYRVTYGYDTRAGYYDYEYGYEGARRQPLRGADAFDGQGRADRAADRMSDFGEGVMERGHDLADRTQDRVSDMAHDARDAVSDVAHRAQDAVEHTAHRARSMASGLAREARHGRHRVEDRLESSLQENPLAVGAAAVALGLAIGLSAPSTRRESELMGPTRDRMLDRARDAAEHAGERVQEVAERAVDSASETVREETRSAGDSAIENIRTQDPLGQSEPRGQDNRML